MSVGAFVHGLRSFPRRIPNPIRGPLRRPIPSLAKPNAPAKRRALARHSRQPTDPHGPIRLAGRDLNRAESKLLCRFCKITTNSNTTAPTRRSCAVSRRDTALQPDRLSPEALRELAYSLQIYEQGRSLLTQATVPDHAPYLRALIGAQIAIEDGSLFYQLHKCLLAKDEPEAWTFLKMKEEDMAYWRQHLAPLLSADPERAQSDAGPIITAAP